MKTIVQYFQRWNFYLGENKNHKTGLLLLYQHFSPLFPVFGKREIPIFKQIMFQHSINIKPASLWYLIEPYRFVFGLLLAAATRLVTDRMVTNSSAEEGCIPTCRAIINYFISNIATNNSTKSPKIVESDMDLSSVKRNDLKPKIYHKLGSFH